MARYRLKKEHYLQDNKAGVEPQLHAAGAEIDWAGKPSLHMEPIDQEATERSAERFAEFDKTKKDAMKRRSSVSTGWSRSYEQNLERIITRPQTAEDAAPQSNIRAKGRKAA